VVWFGVERSKIKVTGSINAFSHYFPQHNSKMNDLKVFKFVMRNDLGISKK